MHSRRAHQERTGTGRPRAAGAAPARVPATAAGILALQRSAGNARVAAILGSAAPAPGPRLHRFKGDARQSLLELAERVLALDLSQIIGRGGEEGLKDAIYEIYGRDPSPAASEGPVASQQAYDQAVNGAARLAGVAPDRGVQEMNVFFTWAPRAQKSADRQWLRRLAINAAPDSFGETLTRVLAVARAHSDFVSDVKVPRTPREMLRCSDNILIYFNERAAAANEQTNAARLAAAMGQGVVTRDDHPAAMTAMAGREGIAVADQSVGGSYGGVIARGMAEAIRDIIRTDQALLMPRYVANATLEILRYRGRLPALLDATGRPTA